MPVGQIYRNQIEGNSVGVGFFGYSGYSGFSGAGGGFGGMVAGSYLWIDDIIVFDSLNGFYTYTAGALHSCWGVFAINDFATQIGPGTIWINGPAVPGFATRIRARALITPWYETVAGTSGQDFWAIRIRKVDAFSYTQGYWDFSMYSFSDATMLITENGRYTYWGSVITPDVSIVYTGTPSSDSGFDLMPSILQTPWVDLPGDGFYIVEVYDWHKVGPRGFIPDKVFVEFAKVKT